MGIIDGLAQIGKGIENAAKYTAESIYNGGKYIFDSPREIKKMSDEKTRADHLHGLFQAALYGMPSNKANAIQILQTKYPEEYAKIADRIQQ